MTPILVVGAGIAGLTAALETAEAGCPVILIEEQPYLGGRVAAFHQYFPKMCPPACGLEIQYRRLRDNPLVTVLTGATLGALDGAPGAYQAHVRMAPRYVTGACTMCGECVPPCPTKAISLPQASAWPPLYAIDRAACPPGCQACVPACRYQAIDLAQQAETRTFSVASVVFATGWEPYDAARLENLGYGQFPNVVTNVMFEKIAAAGKIVRPSDGQEPRTVAFVQCAGSRDENHLPYCSSVCCAASIKQAAYIRAAYPDARVFVFYIDIRVPGRLEQFYAKVAADDKVVFFKGKVAKVAAGEAPGDLLVYAEDAMAGKKRVLRADMVVLATGIVPRTAGLPAALPRDEFGFAAPVSGQTGLYAAGCVHRPSEVSAAVEDATGAALHAFQCAVRSASHG